MRSALPGVLLWCPGRKTFALLCALPSRAIQFAWRENLRCPATVPLRFLLRLHWRAVAVEGIPANEFFHCIATIINFASFAGLGWYTHIRQSPAPPPVLG